MARAWKTLGSVIWTLLYHLIIVQSFFLFQFTFIFKFVIVISVAMGCHYIYGWKGICGCPLFIQILIYSLIFCISIFYVICKNTVEILI